MGKQRQTRPIELILILLAIAILDGCASPAKMESMVATQNIERAPRDASLQRAIQVEEVVGGESTNPMWTSEVGNAEFRGALVESLNQHRLLTAGESRYGLRANLLGLSQPAFGATLTVTAHVNYVLTDKQSGEPYLADTIKTPYSATVGDAFSAVKRLRLANEGAVRENIRTFIQKLLAHEPL